MQGYIGGNDIRVDLEIIQRAAEEALGNGTSLDFILGLLFSSSPIVLIMDMYDGNNDHIGCLRLQFNATQNE